jgi:hypothetical protein
MTNPVFRAILAPKTPAEGDVGIVAVSRLQCCQGLDCGRLQARLRDGKASLPPRVARHARAAQADEGPNGVRR